VRAPQQGAGCARHPALVKLGEAKNAKRQIPVKPQSGSIFSTLLGLAFGIWPLEFDFTRPASFPKTD
jgi:hypothetical protein